MSLWFLALFVSRIRRRRLVPLCSICELHCIIVPPSKTVNIFIVVVLPLTMEPFSIEAFVTAPSLRVVKSLKKDKLM